MHLILNLENECVDKFQDIDGVKDDARSLGPDEFLTGLASVSVVSIREGDLLELVIDGSQDLPHACVNTDM